MTNPHRVRIMQTPGTGLFHASCAACEATWPEQSLPELYPKTVDHQLARANDRIIYRRTDWTEPAEDT